MKRSHLLLLAAAAIGLLALAAASLPSQSTAALAAPSSNSDPFEELFGAAYAPWYQGNEISCTLTYTTTDSLDNQNACPMGNGPETCGDEKAVTLASYDNLALVEETDVPDGEEIEVTAHADWYRLDNAEVGAKYSVEALPKRTTNYNMGIIVYDRDYVPVTSDENAVDNYSAEVSFTAKNAGPYLFKVFQLTPSCSGRGYRLETAIVRPTATPEVVTDADDYEPNDSFDEADQTTPTLPIQVPILLELTFDTEDDQDYFRFYTKDDRTYEATTSDLNLVDTLLEIYDEERKRVERDDDGGGGLASRASWEADYDGYYYIVVRNNVASAGSYDLTLSEVTPATRTPAPSATPAAGPTPRGRADDCEDNLDFQRACVIPVDRAETFNFVPVFGEGPDNDFYRVWVKAGLHFRCETSDLAPGLDPNMIMFNGPSWDNVIAGNDDIDTGNYNSAINYYATYDGWLYVLVGTGDRTPPDVYDSDYTLRCEKSTEPFSAPRTPRPTATPEPTRGPTPTPTTAGSPVATPTPETQELTVRPLTTPAPAAPTPPSPRFVPIQLLVYYDGNVDRQPGAGEGIAGISAQAYEVVSNELLAQDFTDEQGSLEFTVAAQGPVRISIPFLGFSHLVSGAEASIQVRVPPHSLVGGTP
jgi:hypothetical protein